MATKAGSTIDFTDSAPVAELVAAFIERGVQAYETEAGERGGVTAIDRATTAVGKRAVAQLRKIEDAS